LITVIAGVNGAGKSSIAGANIRNNGGDYFNPDEVARTYRTSNPALTETEANAAAWSLGRDQLRRAIDEGSDYILETTLGGHTICALLHEAIDAGLDVRIFFCGLDSPELHIARVAARVAKGGHAIPESKIRERCVTAIQNMQGLLPRCSAAMVFDNSVELDEGGPIPTCLFSLVGDAFEIPPIKGMPAWAKPLAIVAMRRVAYRPDIG